MYSSSVSRLHVSCDRRTSWRFGVTYFITKPIIWQDLIVDCLSIETMILHECGVIRIIGCLPRRIESQNPQSDPNRAF
jgi:hypothetical protein